MTATKRVELTKNKSYVGRFYYKTKISKPSRRNGRAWNESKAVPPRSNHSLGVQQLEGHTCKQGTQWIIPKGRQQSLYLPCNRKWASNREVNRGNKKGYEKRERKNEWALDVIRDLVGNTGQVFVCVHRQDAPNRCHRTLPLINILRPVNNPPLITCISVASQTQTHLHHQSSHARHEPI